MGLRMTKRSGYLYRLVKAAAGAALALAAMTGAAQAQATRTWVSGVGDDAHPCSRTAPCKTFAGAISKTATGGEINVLDPGGFGAVTIAKSISIIAEDVEAGVLVAGTNGVIINAPSTANVTLKGLDFEGLGTGLSGVRILQARNVTILDCTIRGFTNGVLADPAGAIARIVVADSVLEKNANGIVLKPTGGFSARAEIDRSQIISNGGAGVSADANGIARLNGNVITFNVTGLESLNGGILISYGNNAIENNNTNGAPTSTVTLK